MTKTSCVGAWILGVALATGCGSASSLDTVAPGSGTGGSGGVPQAAGGYWTGPQTKSNKLDLLFVVDNSLSMADKEAFLTQAVPGLLSRLTVPNCLDAYGNPTGGVADFYGNCASGEPEARPINDIHIGVVTSSLGGRGKPCTPGMTTNPFDDDRGELVGSLRHTGTAADGTDITYSTYANLGFLAWDATGTANNPAGLNDRTTLLQTLQKMIVAAGEQGCGYESPQEAWYRFLVDPEPPSAIQIVNGQTTAMGTDQTVLTQRAAFLRSDSAVAIVLVADETDCSIIDYGQGWLVAANDQAIPRPTSQCASNPNDPCCRNCQQTGDPYRDCPSPNSDPNCMVDDGDGNGPGYIGVKNNAPNLRCWQTKRRFGFDLLFPIQRYVNALSEPTIANRAGQPAANPLFSGGRSPSLVTMVGIVGVPWQDLATNDTLDAASRNLTLLTFDQMVAAGPNRWDVMLGDPGASPPIRPTDPFMVESIAARSGSNPITGQPIVAANSTDPLATINGHEYNVNPNTLDDLQYACIFQLPSTMNRDCTQPAFNSSDPTQRRGCDCKETAVDHVSERNRPLCQPPFGGSAGTQQYFAKAYPGGRHLELLKRLGPRGVVGSICPKLSSEYGESNASGYGYNAVMNAAVNRLHATLE